MSEETKKRKPGVQRFITAVPLVAILITALALGGWVMALTIAVCLSIALYEELHALKQGGYNPVWWTSFAALYVGVPLVLTHSRVTVAPVLLAATLAALVCVMCREKPELPDILMSVLPILSLVLPGIFLYGILDTDPRSMQLYLLLMTFVIPILGDTMAYFVGSNVGGPKLCPAISPNKTISGAIGGLLGSIFAAVLVGRIFTWSVPGVTFPPFWAELLVGLLGGAAAQIGDLFASMVKRHCKIKDFGHIFPGHGGMLDRLDSIVFTAIIIYCLRAFIGA